MADRMIDPSGEDYNVLVTCAVRFAIGRQSYMPSLVIQAVVPHLEQLETRTLRVMDRDIKEARTLGDELIDKPLWLAFQSRVQRVLWRRDNGQE